jgi:hypothetical protein
MVLNIEVIFTVIYLCVCIALLYSSRVLLLLLLLLLFYFTAGLLTVDIIAT